MNIDPQQVQTFKVEFDAGSMVPPPFHYAYQIEVSMAEEDTPASYEIRYLHREEITEEEILEEGFTLNDDWKWEGKLPPNWKKALAEQIKKQSWPKKPEKQKEEDAVLIISLLNAAGEKLFSGRPADVAVWDYFLQELVQAVYEVAEKEAPFQVAYKEIKSGNEEIKIELEASFAKRSITAVKSVNGYPEKTVHPDWKVLRNLMKQIFIPEYNYENARDQEPKKRGRYINTGEGLWFRFGESITEPDKDSKSLPKLEEKLKELFES